MAFKKKNLLLMYDRPTEPIFMGKTEDNIVFDVPTNYLTSRYQELGESIQSRWGEDAEKVPVKRISIPNIDLPLQLGRYENFSIRVPAHRAMAAKLIDIFMGMRTAEDLFSMTAYCRDRINPFMFNYALTTALIHREDTRDLELPNLLHCFPQKYVEGSAYIRAREEASVVPEGSRVPVVIPVNFTATDLDPEHRIAYFREDLGVNLHHWHWHLVYPFTSTNRALVDKDRRGELFYYMHQQMLARYNFERFSNALPRVTRFNNFRAPIAEGYFPKLDLPVSGRSWPPRLANTSLSDTNRSDQQIRCDIDDLELWRDRFRAAIAQGFAIDPNGRQIPLTEEKGIDILGNIMESSILTPNAGYYGDLHNMLHMVIAFAHDPDGRFFENYGIMGDPATDLRDPIFFRLHAYVDDLFQLHKNKLPRYTVNRLNYPNITLNSVQIDVPGSEPNVLQTHWEQSGINMARGLDFAARGGTFVRFTHLQHEAFSYNIQVNNSSANQMIGTVRIYMAPRFDERNLAIPFNEQRLLMTELDKFKVTLRPGFNNIIRRSDESSLTVPYERTFRDISVSPNVEDVAATQQWNFCGCGWPQHMLIPKGTHAGLPVVLFVMVSNYKDDRIDQDISGICNDADSFCGIKDKLYPDKRSMGYPFDRIPREGVRTLDDFLTPNMKTQDVTIKFTERTNIRSEAATTSRRMKKTKVPKAVTKST